MPLPSWINPIQERVDQAENDAAKAAYESDLGASEWEAFMSIAEQDRQALLSAYTHLYQLVEKLDHDDGCEINIGRDELGMKIPRAERVCNCWKLEALNWSPGSV